MTAIEWTDVTWNPVRGCSRVSPGCENCYAERQAARPILSAPGKPYHGLVTVRSQASGLRYESPGAAGSWTAPRWSGKVILDAETLTAPLRWKKPRRVFVNSMSDMFHESLTDEQIAAVFGVMAATPQHTYQILTKRPERLARWFDWLQTRPYHPVVDCMDYAHASLGGAGFYKPINDKTPNGSPWPLRNVWLGVSVEDQQRADERIPHLLRVPAAVRFLSVEPMLGPVNLSTGLRIAWQCSCCAGYFPDPWRKVCPTCNREDYWSGSHRFNPPGKQRGSGIDWVIVGGESGPGARPCNVEWVRSIVAQCKAAEVPVFVKQLGGVVISDSDDDRRFAGDMTLPHPFRLHLSDRKGGDQSEWPEGLRVREFPDVTP